MVKIVSIVGARPQFIKAATVTRAIAQRNQSCPPQDKLIETIVHTGQHYDTKMSHIFFDELHIPQPDYNLEIGSDSHGRQTGKMLAEIEHVLTREDPDLVLTYGDTNSTLAGALAAVKLHIPTAHVEAGLRSYNRKMPEEINRIVVDEISHILFCPTSTAVANLASEGIVMDPTAAIQPLDWNSQRVFQVGDVMYDSLLFYATLAERTSTILARLGLSKHAYCLATLHRPENTDNPGNLHTIFEALRIIASAGTPIIVPLHPRTKAYLEKFGLKSAYGVSCSQEETPPSGTNLSIIDPVGYLDMIQLETHARAIFTDSGGIQKESFLLGVPCITLRDQTEWVETVEAQWNILTGAYKEQILRAFSQVSTWKEEAPPFQLDRPQRPYSKNPYGDGKASEKIVEIILEILCTK